MASLFKILGSFPYSLGPSLPCVRSLRAFGLRSRWRHLRARPAHGDSCTRHGGLGGGCTAGLVLGPGHWEAEVGMAMDGE